MRLVNSLPADGLPALRWRKSQVSNPTGSCVEIAELAHDTIAIRNSRDKAGPALVYPRPAVGAFLKAVKNGEFDCLVRLRANGGPFAPQAASRRPACPSPPPSRAQVVAIFAATVE